MPKYIVASEGPISVKEIESGDPLHPMVPPTRPSLPPGWEPPDIPPIPPRDEWPPLPPWLEPGPGLPIPPTPEHPMVPVQPPAGVTPPEWWPPVKPEFPDLSGKSLALALVYVSRHVARWHWVIIDHDEAKQKWQAIKDRIPAGGIVGRPPSTPGRPY